ncbi:hypothetical protein F4604DRAFT_2865 [Suillus subluteus]|nr:hypothetical protein F4604DRAFT_2865 [Suillus subluteus]
MYLSTMPKRKLFNVANLGSWAKSLGHSGNKENEVPMTTNMSDPFHCELNFIEQCWGYAKRIYRQYPTSSKEVDLERNVLSALESVPLDSMRRCVNC